MPRAIEEVLRKADVMLAVGTRFSSLSMRHWSLKVPENLIHVDIEHEEIGKNYPAKVGVVGDAKSVLQQIAKRLRSLPRINRSDWGRLCKELKDSVWKELKTSHPTEVEAVMKIRSVLERNAIVAADTKSYHTGCRDSFQSMSRAPSYTPSDMSRWATLCLPLLLQRSPFRRDR